MAVLLKQRYSQPVHSIEFEWNHSDTMVSNAGGTAVDFGLTNTATTVFTMIKLPVGAVVVDGELAVETAFDAASYTVIIGDSATANRYMASADKKAAARTALTLTGYKVTDATNDVYVSITAADVCTTGKAILRLQFVQPARATEVTAGP